MKLELVLTTKEQKMLEHKAAIFGADVSTYVKFVLGQETRALSPVALRRVRGAWKAYRQKKTVSGKTFKELLA